LTIITQNIDDLHERAGSKNIIHLHGIITRSQSDLDASLTYPIAGWELKKGDLCRYGKQLRPHVVWFGEDVPMIQVAARVCAEAELFVVVGTSLAVYPAAGLIDFVPEETPKYIVDPKIPVTRAYGNLTAIAEKATAGFETLYPLLLQYV
ncbi:MAG: NAD-dependent deacylase, partial [Pedobacter sp.]